MSLVKALWVLLGLMVYLAVMVWVGRVLRARREEMESTEPTRKYQDRLAHLEQLRKFQDRPVLTRKCRDRLEPIPRYQAPRAR